ncbi:carbohydrate deacetylase [Paenibacillus hamazuiensis]|uniref:carbohydrate deacetylase n=1 Tax=Paenibacillus hamazuiensis TaxID=2936508 RepID=UPI00200D728E|nr:carbohydrate deacetylase [Paenibacillus hamazuiensis]
MKYLIINADDFGLSPGVNKGIAEAYGAGTITSATLMVNMPGFSDAVGLSRLLPGLGVGLHFNLTYGKPVSDPRLVPSLVQKDGSFHPITAQCTREEGDIETELAAQWNRFVEIGRKPTHLDSHHHIHQVFPAVYKAMIRLAEKENVPMRRLQTPHELTVTSPRTTDYVLLDSYHKQDGLQRLLHYLRHLPNGTTELMCHPGYIDDTVREISGLKNERESELAVFRHPLVSQIIRESNINLIHYGNLGELGEKSPQPETAMEMEEIRPSVVLPSKAALKNKKRRKVSRRKKKTINMERTKKRPASPAKRKKKKVLSRAGKFQRR